MKNNLIVICLLSFFSFFGSVFSFTSVYAQQQDNIKGSEKIEFLFIQTAKSGLLSQINETAYTLELNNVSSNTITFSDRPERIVETMSTSDFVGNWTLGPDSFASYAPNDALIVQDAQTGNLDVVVIESFNPVYDTNTNTLTYTIMADNGTSINLPNQFGESILVVDFRGCLDGDWSSGCETGPG